MAEENTTGSNQGSTSAGTATLEGPSALAQTPEKPITGSSGGPVDSGGDQAEKSERQDIKGSPGGPAVAEKDVKDKDNDKNKRENKKFNDDEKTLTAIGWQQVSNRSASLEEFFQKAKEKKLDDVQSKLSGVRAGAKKFLGDPTRQLTDPKDERELFQFDTKIIEDWAGKLESDRFILMRCPDELVVYSAAFAIARAPQFNLFEKRELPFGSEAKIQTDVSLEYLCHPQIGSAHTKTLIVVFAYLSDSDSFLQSLPTSPDRVSYFYKLLALNRKVLVVTTPGRLRVAQPQRSMAYTEVDFLPSRLRKRFPDAWKDVEQDLLKQFTKGLWGPKGDVEEFYYRVQVLLEDGSLEAEIRLRNQYVNDANPVTAFHTRQEGPLGEILRDDTPLENAVAFVATYFKRLPAEEFQKVLLKLLGEQSIEITVPGASPGTETMRPKLLRQIWTERRQAILKACNLRPMGSTPPIIEFNPMEIRDRLERDFESHFVFLWEDMYRGVEGTGLLFDSKESVSDAVIRLTARRVKNNLDGYGEEFLSGLILFANGPPKHAVASLDSMRDVLTGLSGSRRHHVISRLGTLLNFLVEEGCDAVVDRGMKALLDAQCQAEALQLLQRLADSRYLEKKIFLLRRIFNESEEKIREAAYRLLFEWALQGGSGSASLLKNVYAWCDGGISPSSHVALQLLVHLCEWGITPSSVEESHPLASALLAADAETRSALISWLLGLETGPGDWQEMEWRVGTALLAFLWIMPRPIPDDFFTSNRFLCACIQITWSVALENVLQERLADLQAGEVCDSFRALAVMDCALALAVDGTTANAPAALQQLAEAVAKMETRKRASVLAHCDAVGQALNECIEMSGDVIGLFGDGATIQAAKTMKERWKTIRYQVRDFRNRVRQSTATAKPARGGN